MLGADKPELLPHISHIIHNHSYPIKGTDTETLSRNTFYIIYNKRTTIEEATINPGRYLKAIQPPNKPYNASRNIIFQQDFIGARLMKTPFVLRHSFKIADHTELETGNNRAANSKIYD